MNGEMGEERLNCFELMSLLHLQDNQELWHRICEAVLVKLFPTVAQLNFRGKDVDIEYGNIDGQKR